jgi:hypothetical protein
MDRRKSLIPLCRHTKTNGCLCGSPALSGRAFCYFHQKNHYSRDHGGRPARPRSLETSASIQQELSAIYSGLLSGRLRLSQAGKMLFLLQTAATNLRKRPMQ